MRKTIGVGRAQYGTTPACMQFPILTFAAHEILFSPRPILYSIMIMWKWYATLLFREHGFDHESNVFLPGTIYLLKNSEWVDENNWQMVILIISNRERSGLSLHMQLQLQK